jgi:uncharacterized protein
VIDQSRTVAVAPALPMAAGVAPPDFSPAASGREEEQGIVQSQTISTRKNSANFVAMAAVISAVAVMAGCGGTIYTAQDKFRTGDTVSALSTIEPVALNKSSDVTTDPETGLEIERRVNSNPAALLVWLEYGSMLHHAGRFDESTDAFTLAENRLREIDSDPDLRFSDEFVGYATNPENMRYIGTAYDRVMSPLYRGLNAMLLGDMETPRQAFNEAENQQVAAVQFRQRLIDEMNAERQERQAKLKEEDGADVDLEASSNVEQAKEDDRFREDYEQAYGDIDRYQPYGTYAVPFASLLHAVYLLGTQEDTSDADKARSLLRQIAGMVDDDASRALVFQTLNDAEAGVRGQRVSGVTYIVFSTGVAPSRDQVRIDLPIILVDQRNRTGVPYVGVAFPKLVFHNSYEPYLTVFAPQGTVHTHKIADMDRIIAADFKAEFPLMLTRAVVSAAIKAGAAWAANEATKDQGWLNIITVVTTTVYQAINNKADRRTWASLPKQVQFARIQTPSDGIVRLHRSTGEELVFEVDPAGVGFIYVRSINPEAPALARAVDLR